MSVFKKTCFDCGAKVDELKDGLCEDCYGETSPPIKEIKPINAKYCNSCNKIEYNNHFFTIDEFEEGLPGFLKKKVVLNEGYKLNHVDVDNFSIKGNKISFDILVDSDLK